ncbi:helix-turn-helix domain-containing protein [Cronobacter malonaticus]|uniref:helix-turn-helix domain-containing protein n=1 Tax=Cronobacter malonaticus TaxID=413503 RepID=UPI002DB86171|nr:helix-turn-helix domain-containing protein [Cronobacter malonaticus]MEB8677827.1 helix-turn-helix domain-containing protein [Cronobacter malonaticus]
MSEGKRVYRGSLRLGNPLRKLVLIKLADNASDKGECWPSYQHIADQCEITKRSVMNHIAALCEAGLVEKEIRIGPKGNSSNLYILKLNNPAKSPAGSERNSLGGSESGSLHSEPLSLGGSESGSLHSEPLSLGGSESGSPRTSHFIEPVNEPITSENTSASSGAVTKHKDLIGPVRSDAAIRSPKGDKWGTVDDLRTAELIFGKVQEVTPVARKPNWAAWANDIRLMRLALNVTHAEIWQVFTWANTDHFWQTNILCPAKLREKWLTLTAQMMRPSRQRSIALEQHTPHWNSPEAWEEVL